MFDKIKHQFFNDKKKPLNKAGIEQMYLNILKVTYDKLTGNIIVNSEKLKAFPLRSRTRLGCSCMHAKSLQLWPTLWDPWTVVYHAPLSMGFSRQEYWSGLPCPPPGDLPDPGVKPASLKTLLHWQPASLPPVPPGKPLRILILSFLFKTLLEVLTRANSQEKETEDIQIGKKELKTVTIWRWHDIIDIKP